MTVKVFQAGDDVYLTGAGQTPCLRWYRDGERWRSEPAQLPDGAVDTQPDGVPDDLREELLAFIVRANAVGAGQRALGN